MRAMQLLDNDFLQNELVDTMHFLEDLSIKDPSEKNKFFRQLPNRIPHLPNVVCTRKLLPLISSALSYGGAPALALGCLLQVCPCSHAVREASRRDRGVGCACTQQEWCG
jgi:SCY1-like protein 1